MSLNKKKMRAQIKAAVKQAPARVKQWKMTFHQMKSSPKKYDHGDTGGSAS